MVVNSRHQQIKLRNLLLGSLTSANMSNGSRATILALIESIWK